MGRRTVTLNDAEEEIIEQKVGDGAEYDSVSEFVRTCVTECDRLAEQVEDLEAELVQARDDRDRHQERAADLEERIDELESEIQEKTALADDLRQQLQAANSKDDRIDTLANYVEDERRVEQQWREAPLWTRAKWRVLGMPDNSTA